jgi:methylthioxylose transferase
LVVVAVGLVNKANGNYLGSAFQPFVMRWGPEVNPLVLVSIVVFAGALTITPAILQRVSSGRRFAGSVYLLTVALGLSLNLAHHGDRGLWAMFSTGSYGSYEGHFEYLLGLPLLNPGIGYFLHYFPTQLFFSTTHIKGNPPGPLIALHILGIHTAPQLAALCIVLGALTTPLAYDFARQIGDEDRARAAAVLTAFCPACLLFGFSSVDYVFAMIAMVAVCLLARPGSRFLVAGAAVAAVGTFFSWLLFAIPAFSALLALQRSGLRRAIGIGAACAAAIIVMNGALAVIYDYNVFDALKATEHYYNDGVATVRPYSFWLFASPTAWAVMIGLPVVWFSLRALPDRDPVAVTLWTMIAAASLLGVTKAETERIWLPFAPLVCVAAAAVLPKARLRPILLILSLQALAVELVFFTIW